MPFSLTAACAQVFAASAQPDYRSAGTGGLRSATADEGRWG
jgi:hypothetical protein